MGSLYVTRAQAEFLVKPVKKKEVTSRILATLKKHMQGDADQLERPLSPGYLSPRELADANDGDFPDKIIQAENLIVALKAALAEAVK